MVMQHGKRMQAGQMQAGTLSASQSACDMKPKCSQHGAGCYLVACCPMAGLVQLGVGLVAPLGLALGCALNEAVRP